MNICHRHVIAAIAVLLATQAWGTSSGSTRMTLQVELFDLDPLDGSAPWVSFASVANPLNLIDATAFQSYPSAIDQVVFTGGPTWVPEAANANTTDATAASRFETSGTAHGSTLTTTGATIDFTQHSGDFAQAVARVAIVGNLTLSANTRLVVTGIGNMSAVGTSSRDTMVLDASLRLNRPSSTGGTDHSYDSASFETPIVRTPFVYSRDFVLTSFLTNASAVPMDGTLTAFTMALPNTYGLPIPEPRTLDLMFFGLGLLGAALHRRARALGTATVRPPEPCVPPAWC